MPQKTMQCPNCGGTMTVEYQGAWQDKQIVCKFCGTTHDVADTFKRVTRKSSRRRGLLRGKEVIEEITEFHSDHPMVEQPQPQAQTIHIPIHLSGSRNTGIWGGCVAWILCTVFICCMSGGAIVIAVDVGFNDWLAEVNGDGETIENVAAHRVIKGDDSLVSVIAYSPDGSTIAAGSTFQIRLWSVETGLITTELKLDLPLSDGDIHFDRDGSQVIVLTGSKITFYDTARGQSQRTIEGHYRQIAVSPDQEYFAAATLR